MSIRVPRAKRVVRTGALAAAVVSLSLAGLLAGDTPPSDRGAIGIGNVKTLTLRYERWQASYARGGGAETFIVPLGPMRMGTAALNHGRGRAMLDLTTGRLLVEVRGLAASDALELWLVHDRRTGQQTFHAGTLAHESSRHVLDRRLDLGALRGFEIDRIAVTRRGASTTTPLLSGSPSLFQRLYHRTGVRSLGGIQYAEERLGGGSAGANPFALLVPTPAYAASPSPEALLAALIAEGERLFFQETFNGNGRTCGTCHRAERNFAIDPAFIATLSPDDPLFVAETNPALAANFENPTLMRERGLILENVDGTDDLENKFTMRGVPHTLSMLTSMSSVNAFDEPFDRTGWSGDGAPGAGTLREFAIGAVRQHFTLTLNRNADPNLGPVDFRLPTEDELNAMEAFQLSLGRHADLDLNELGPKLRSAVARLGRELFQGAGKCNTCHFNAGATASFAPGINRDFDTGVEALSTPGVPRDGGAGTAFNPAINAFGTGLFNTPSLVEAADTTPLFHNNIANTIEEGVRFYTTTAFTTSPAAVGRFGTGPIILTEPQIAAIAAFLRVINADFNLGEATKYEESALQTSQFSKASRLITLAAIEVNDAIRVLSEVRLHPEAVLRLRVTKGLLDFAAKTRLPAARNGLIAAAITQQNVAKSLLIEP